MQVALFDGKGQMFTFFGPALLKGGRGAQGGVEGDVGGAVGGAGFDVASPVALGDGFRAASGPVAGEFVQRGIQPARRKGFPRFNFLAALPPIGVLRGKNFLPCRFRAGGRIVTFGLFFYD